MNNSEWVIEQFRILRRKLDGLEISGRDPYGFGTMRQDLQTLRDEIAARFNAIEADPMENDENAPTPRQRSKGARNAVLPSSRSVSG